MGMEANTTNIILETPDNTFDIYRLDDATYDEFGQFDESSFVSFDQLTFVESVETLPEGARQIHDDEPTGPDYVASYVA